jgi:hypothetical protein
MKYSLTDPEIKSAWQMSENKQLVIPNLVRNLYTSVNKEIL